MLIKPGLTLIGLIGLVTIFSLIPDGFSQVNSTNNSSTNEGNWTKYFSETEDYLDCTDIPEYGTYCSSYLNILYESPATIAITSDKIDLIWKAVDEVKKDGFKIDDVTSYSITETSYAAEMSGIEPTDYINILVVMSK